MTQRKKMEVYENTATGSIRLIGGIREGSFMKMWFKLRSEMNKKASISGGDGDEAERIVYTYPLWRDTA